MATHAERQQSCSADIPARGLNICGFSGLSSPASSSSTWRALRNRLLFLLPQFRLVFLNFEQVGLSHAGLGQALGQGGELAVDEVVAQPVNGVGDFLPKI